MAKNMYERFERQAADSLLKKTDKPLRTPEKRFVVLPGHSRRRGDVAGGEIIRKESERYGSEKFSGDVASDKREYNRKRSVLMRESGATRKSSGQHYSNSLKEGALAPQSKINTEPTQREPEYKKEAEEYRAQRYEEDAIEDAVNANSHPPKRAIKKESNAPI